MLTQLDQATGEFVRWKTPWNHDTAAESTRTGLTCLDESKAQQHSKDECDINVIVDRFLKSGTLPPVKVPPTYADFNEVFDLQTALDQVRLAQESFAAMPAGTRARFQNDPTKFVAYVDHCLSTGDLDPLREMNLAVPAAPVGQPVPEPGAPPPEPPKPPEGVKSDPST